MTAEQQTVETTPEQSNAQLVELKLSEIKPNTHQPRRSMSEDRLSELAASIRSSGVMQPILVRPSGRGGGYELIAGERRWRAARMAGLDTVPAIVRAVSDDDSATLALVENVQREDLNPIDRAHAMRALVEKFGLTHDELASRVGLGRPTISNMIRLTELEDPIQQLIERRGLSTGHAKVLLSVNPGAERVQLAADAARERWTVRELERQAKEIEGARARAAAAGSNGPKGDVRRLTAITDLERKIEETLGVQTRIKTTSGGTRGTIELRFGSLGDFDQLMNRLGVKPD